MGWNEQLTQIEPLQQESMHLARQHWNQIGKPLYSLGQLEELVVQLAGIRKTPSVSLNKRRVYVFCADNGVVAEGVTQTDQSVTAIVAESIAKGQGNISAMARQANAEVVPVDLGIATKDRIPGVLPHKIAYGTKNLAQEPAMTAEQAGKAITVGIELAKQAKADGCDLLITGEMGIGNTTTSSAMLSVLLGLPPNAVTGRGAGLSDAGLLRKQTVIAKAIALHQPDANDPFSVLCKLGGFDLAGMVGLFLGGAIYRIPVVIDGLISGTAALTAQRICPITKDYMFPSHCSRETAMAPLLQAMQLHAPLDCGMALGEGTGAVCLLPLLDLALSVYQQDTTFAQIQMEPYTDFGTERKC